MVTESSPVQSSDELGFRWSGQPLLDMGTAILVAFADRDAPEQLTTGDLQRFASYADDALFVKAVRSHASVVFTSNAPYLQPSFAMPVQRQKARELVRAFEMSPISDGPACTYCGRPSVRAGTETGRAYREMIPMLTGQGVINFFPAGQHGLALCGACITALQALAIGAPSCEGRALILSADDPSHLVAVIKEWLPDIRRRIQLSETSGEKVETWKAPRSRLIERLIALEERDAFGPDVAGFTIFHMSNSGQGPDIRIYTLAATVVSFVRRAQAQAHRAAWRAVERRSWVDSQRRASEGEPSNEDRPRWQNRFYEDLFQLPAESVRFLRRYFLSYQRATLDLRRMAEPVPMWTLAGLLLTEVMAMDQVRIDAVRSLADALMDEILGDKRLFRQVYRVKDYYGARRFLLRVSADRLERGQRPLIDLDDFLLIFEDESLRGFDRWRFPWDLLLIRVIDEMHRQGVFRENPELAQEFAETASTESDEEAESIELGGRR